MTPVLKESFQLLCGEQTLGEQRQKQGDQQGNRAVIQVGVSNGSVQAGIEEGAGSPIYFEDEATH